MKRLHYIHDLENKSTATTNSVKELSAEVDRMQEQHRTMAEAVEDGKTQGAAPASLTGGSPGIPVSQMHAMAIEAPPLVEASGAPAAVVSGWQEPLQQQASAEAIAVAAGQELAKRAHQRLISSQEPGPQQPGLHGMSGSYEFQLQLEQQQVPAVPDVQDVNMDDSAATVPSTDGSCDEAGAVGVATVPAPLLQPPPSSKSLETADFNALGLAGMASAGDGEMLAGLNEDDDLEGLLQADQSFLGEGTLYPGGDLAALRDELVMGSLMDLRKTSSL
eukprot:gene7207-7421_t